MSGPDGQIHYGFAEMLAISGAIKGKSGQLSGANDELLGYVNGLRAQWDSNAQRDYDVVQNKWQSSHQEIIQVLRQISQTVDEVAQKMAETDARNAGAWHG